MGVQQMQAVRKQILYVTLHKPWESGWLSSCFQGASGVASSRHLHATTKNFQKSSPASTHSYKTVNPIRQICDKLHVESISKKPLITLHLGDPSNTGALPSCPGIQDAIMETLKERKFYGYGPAHGFPEAREAVAKHFSLPEAPFTKDDVIMTSGCSHALQMTMEVLANPGENILMPSPSFPLYKTLTRPHGIQNRFYPLDMKTNETRIDLEKLESLIDEDTRAIIVNNPSNPTGAVFPKEHLEAVLRIAEKHKLVVVADEVYGELAWNNAKFIPMATLQPKVPILTVDSISKRYLVPGWRLGWIIIHDPNGTMGEIRKGLVNLSQKIVGPSALIQGALPKILDRTPRSYIHQIRDLLAINAEVAFKLLSNVPGIHPIKPSGAMYLVVKIDEKLLGDEKTVVEQLIYEENVYCLPGEAFFRSGLFRLVLIYPKDVTIEACNRIVEFCKRKAAKK